MTPFSSALRLLWKLDVLVNHSCTDTTVLHALTQERWWFSCVTLAATHLPVVQLNFAAVSQETPFSRDAVEGCIRETLQLLFRSLTSEQNIFVTFHGIGVLSFKNNKVTLLLVFNFLYLENSDSWFSIPSNLSWCASKVRMKFNRDFINAMDGTGRILLAFNNVSVKKFMYICMIQHLTDLQCIYSYRSLVLWPLQRPGSSISLLSGGLSRLQRPQTGNPIALPTVCSPQPDCRAADKDGCCLSLAPEQRSAGGERAVCTSRTIRVWAWKHFWNVLFKRKRPTEIIWCSCLFFCFLAKRLSIIIKLYSLSSSA